MSCDRVNTDVIQYICKPKCKVPNCSQNKILAISTCATYRQWCMEPTGRKWWLQHRLCEVYKQPVKKEIGAAGGGLITNRWKTPCLLPPPVTLRRMHSYVSTWISLNHIKSPQERKCIQMTAKTERRINHGDTGFVFICSLQSLAECSPYNSSNVEFLFRVIICSLQHSSLLQL